MHAYVHICTHFCVRDFIVLILSSPILTLLVSLSFLTLFTLGIQELIFFVSDTHQWLQTVSYFTFHGRLRSLAMQM